MTAVLTETPCMKADPRLENRVGVFSVFTTCSDRVTWLQPVGAHQETQTFDTTTASGRYPVNFVDPSGLKKAETPKEKRERERAEKKLEELNDALKKGDENAIRRELRELGDKIKGTSESVKAGVVSALKGLLSACTKTPVGGGDALDYAELGGTMTTNFYKNDQGHSSREDKFKDEYGEDYTTPFSYFPRP